MSGRDPLAPGGRGMGGDGGVVVGVEIYNKRNLVIQRQRVSPRTEKGDDNLRTQLALFLA